MKYVMFGLMTLTVSSAYISKQPNQDQGFDFAQPCPEFAQSLALSQAEGQDREAKIAKALKDLKDKDAKVRMTAVGALGLMNAKEHSKQVAELLKDGDMLVRSLAAEALGMMKAKEYAKEVAKLLKDEALWVKCSAMQALGRMEAKEYAKEVVELLKHKHRAVRANSAWALGRLVTSEEAKANGFAKAVAQLLGDEDVCFVFDESKKEYVYATVGAVAADVLKTWGYVPEKK